MKTNSHQSFSCFYNTSPDFDPVPHMLTGHQRLQIISTHVEGRTLVDLLWRSLQQTHWNISASIHTTWQHSEISRLAKHRLYKTLLSFFSYWCPQACHLHRKESHSSMKFLVFSTPCVSEPQCSRPLLVKSRRMSRRSLEEISQCLFSLISVKSHGLIRAPLQEHNSINPFVRSSRETSGGQTHLAIMIPETPVSLAFMASS